MASGAVAPATEAERLNVNRVHRLRALALVLLIAVAFAPGVSRAGDDTASEAGLGVGSALCSLVYGPVKLVYATLGLLFGGLAWGLSGGDQDVLDAVITPAVRGDYVVTPSHLRGDRSLEFFGRAETSTSCKVSLPPKAYVPDWSGVSVTPWMLEDWLSTPSSAAQSDGPSITSGPSTISISSRSAKVGRQSMGDVSRFSTDNFSNLAPGFAQQ